MTSSSSNSAPVRILHAIGSLNVGGSQAFVMNLYRVIDRSRVQFDFVVEHPGELFFKDEIEALGGRVFELHPFKGTNLVSYHRQWVKLLDAHPEWHVLHSHVRSTASLYFPAARKRGVVTVVHSHSTAEAPGFSGAVKRIFEFPLRYQADYYFACSKKAGEFLYGRKLASSNELVVLANAIDVDLYRFDPIVRCELRGKLGFASDDLIVGHVGRFVEQKNHAFIIDVFCAILDLVPSAKLLLVGEGPLMGRIHDLVEMRGIADSVYFLGARSDVHRFYQMMDVLLFPSLNEGLGIALVEAQASGLPCVYADTVPPEACLVPTLCSCLKLTDAPSAWARECIDAPKDRRESFAEGVRAAGYDLRSTVKALQDFYLDLGIHKKADINDLRSRLACRM